MATISYGKEAFGDKYVRKIGAADIDHFLVLTSKLSDSTQAKHLRVLGAMFRAAVRRGYCPRNPVERLGNDQRPQASRRESAYFTDDELPRLFAEIPEGLYQTLFAAALKTGMREGELAALPWPDVNLTEATISVRRNYTARKLSTTKNRNVRHVAFSDEVVELLGAWWGECGRPVDDVLVFPGSGREGYLNPSYLTRGILYPAMKRAGIPRVGATGEKRTFHSLRHTYARIALQSGAEIFWLSRQMGHSSVTITTDTYGHWEQKASRREADKVAFPSLGI